MPVPACPPARAARRCVPVQGDGRARGAPCVTSMSSRR